VNLVSFSRVNLEQSIPRSLMEARVSSATDFARAIEWQVSPAWVVYVLPERQVLLSPLAVLGNVSCGGGFGVVEALTLHSRNCCEQGVLLLSVHQALTRKDAAVAVNHGIVVSEEHRVLNCPHVVDLAVGAEDRFGQALQTGVAVGSILVLQPL